MDINCAEHNTENAVSLDALRGQTLQRLAGVQQRLESKGVGAAFIQAARPDPIGDIGFLGALIANVIFGAPIADLFGCHATAHFNDAAVIGGLEGVAVLRDQEADKYRSRAFSKLYPEGRRKCLLKQGANLKKKFNLVSANQNNKLSYDAQAEMACMYEILDMLDSLERRGAKMIRFEKEQPVYDVLKQAGKPKQKSL